MGLTIAEKIIKEHLRAGEMRKGEEIALKIDQTLTQDATGTMAYLEFETMGIPRVRTELSAAYIDHNTLQSGFMNADDHRFIRSMAKKYGLYFSRPGNGICHQVHLERFGKPGKTLIGSDSHTPTGGGIGMLAMGAGGLDVAVAMGGGAYHITMPKMIKVELTGKLRPFVTAKDVSLELLRRISVKGGVGAIIEWSGEGVKTLSVPERATITNMGTETGATTSIFPSDEVTREFLKAEGREEDWVELLSDDDAVYDQVIEMDLSSLEPLIACPHSPDNVVKVSELKDVKVDQVCIGSCTNSSLYDMLKVAEILKGRVINPDVSLSISPGSKQVLSMLADCGALSDILAAGARVLECACGPCIGMGFSPNSGGVSLRTFNRNFEGRSGTADGQVYLVSPETAADSSTRENTDRTAGSTAPASKSDLPAKENEFQLIARRQSEELGKMIGETFRDMAQRMEELERLHRAQGRRAKLWMAVAALILLLLLFGTFFGYRSHRQLLSVSRANTELKQETASANRQLQELQRQSVELIAGTEKFRSNIALLEKQLREQKAIFDRNIGTVRRDFEKAAAAHQSQLAAEKEKNAALLKMKDAELALEKEKFAAERLKFLRDIERMSSDNENIVRDLKRQMDQRNPDPGKQLPEDMK